MDKAPDAFRTISEVADELDVPQHVLRFWETRFAQIKPMKRSGGRRYYRPDDVDLLKGIRRLLYGEGYTIRGVQRILREQGIKSVQGLADLEAPSPSAVIRGKAAPRTAPRFDADEAIEDDEAAAAPVPVAARAVSAPAATKAEEDTEDDEEEDEADDDAEAEEALAGEEENEDGDDEEEDDEDDGEEEEDADDEAEDDEVTEALTPVRPAAAPTPRQVPPVRVSSATARPLQAGARDRLCAALADLEACKAMIDGALAHARPELLPPD